MPLGDADDAATENQSVSSRTSTVSKFDSLYSKIKKKETKKRTFFRIPFQLSPSFEFGIRGYNLVIEQKKGAHVNLDERTNQQVKIISGYTCAV